MKRVMGIDYGDARTGVALSDLMCSIVGSSQVIPSRNRQKAIGDIVRIAKENDVGEIVVGLPKNMDGTEGFRAEATYEFADKLRKVYDGKIEFVDERLTTMGAAQFLNATNTRGQKRKDVIDTVSAGLILENYMRRKNNG